MFIGGMRFMLLKDPTISTSDHVCEHTWTLEDCLVVNEVHIRCIIVHPSSQQ